MAPPVRVEKVGEDHGIPPDSSQGKGGPLENQKIVLEVMSHLLHGRVGHEGSEDFHRSSTVYLGFAGLMGDGDVEGLSGLEGQGETDQVRPNRIWAVGLRVQGHPPRPTGPLDQCAQFLRRGDALIRSLLLPPFAPWG